MSRPVLVLRPEPGATRTASAARGLGLEALTVPLFELQPVPWIPPEAGRFDAVMFTSSAALDHGGEALRRYLPLPAYAVGSATAAPAAAAGFADVRVGASDATALAERLANDGMLRVLHLGGADRVEAMATGVTIERVTVYEAVAVDEPDGLFDALALSPVALLHSPRAARRLAELVDDRAGIGLAGLSPTVLAAAGSGWGEAKAADRPDDALLLALAAGMCE